MSILVAVDGETVPDAAVETGYELAQQYGEELVALHVMGQDLFESYRSSSDSQPVLGTSLAPGVTYGSDGEPTPDSDRYSIKDAERRCETVAREVVEGTLDDWQNVRFEGRVGDPVTEILDDADRQDARFLVIGGRKRSPIGKAVFGSVTQSLLLQAEVPVVTVLHRD